MLTPEQKATQRTGLEIVDSFIQEAQGMPKALAILNAIRDCILTFKPIPQDLQEQYVKLLANDFKVDKYGK